MSCHTIYYPWFLDLRGGGPTGYLANLRYGLDRLEERTPLRIERRRKTPEMTPRTPAAAPSEEVLRGLVNYFSAHYRFRLDDEEFRGLMAHSPLSVHAHTCADALKIIQSFEVHGITGIPVCFTSHCPESFGKEMADTWRLRGADPTLCDALERAAREVETLAFLKSDIWIFPSPEAMDPYHATIPSFARWARDRDVRFVATGVCSLRPTMCREAAKASFGLSGKRVLGYFGRHNMVKGYDQLCKAGLGILAEREDIAVLVAGELDGLSPPAHPRWKELGWFDRPADLLAACDLFLLPNRMTYFDIALIEAMSVGTPIIASATGGNISVHAMTDGAIMLFEGGADGLKRAALRLLDDPIESKRLGRAAREAYLAHFTPETFARNFIGLARSIWEDYGITDPAPAHAARGVGVLSCAS